MFDEVQDLPDLPNMELNESWQGNLCHKGKSIASVSVFGGVQLPVDMPKELEVHQKVKFSEFTSKVVTENTSLKFSEIEFNEEHGLMVSVFKPKVESPVMTNFLSFLNKSKSVAVSVIEENNSVVFFIPSSLAPDGMFPPISQCGTVTGTEVMFGVFKLGPKYMPIKQEFKPEFGKKEAVTKVAEVNNTSKTQQSTDESEDKSVTVSKKQPSQKASNKSNGTKNKETKGKVGRPRKGILKTNETTVSAPTGDDISNADKSNPQQKKLSLKEYRTRKRLSKAKPDVVFDENPSSTPPAEIAEQNTESNEKETELQQSVDNQSSNTLSNCSETDTPSLEEVHHSKDVDFPNAEITKSSEETLNTCNGDNVQTGREKPQTDTPVSENTVEKDQTNTETDNTYNTCETNETQMDNVSNVKQEFIKNIYSLNCMSDENLADTQINSQPGQKCKQETLNVFQSTDIRSTLDPQVITVQPIQDMERNDMCDLPNLITTANQIQPSVVIVSSAIATETPIYTIDSQNTNNAVTAIVTTRSSTNAIQQITASASPDCNIDTHETNIPISADNVQSDFQSVMDAGNISAANTNIVETANVPLHILDDDEEDGSDNELDECIPVRKESIEFEPTSYYEMLAKIDDLRSHLVKMNAAAKERKQCVQLIDQISEALMVKRTHKVSVYKTVSTTTPRKACVSYNAMQAIRPNGAQNIANKPFTQLNSLTQPNSIKAVNKINLPHGIRGSSDSGIENDISPAHNIVIDHIHTSPAPDVNKNQHIQGTKQNNTPTASNHSHMSEVDMTQSNSVNIQNSAVFVSPDNVSNAMSQNVNTVSRSRHSRSSSTDSISSIFPDTKLSRHERRSRSYDRRTRDSRSPFPRYSNYSFNRRYDRFGHRGSWNNRRFDKYRNKPFSPGIKITIRNGKHRPASALASRNRKEWKQSDDEEIAHGKAKTSSVGGHVGGHETTGKKRKREESPVMPKVNVTEIDPKAEAVKKRPLSIGAMLQQVRATVKSTEVQPTNISEEEELDDKEKRFRKRKDKKDKKKRPDTKLTRHKSHKPCKKRISSESPERGPRRSRSNSASKSAETSKDVQHIQLQRQRSMSPLNKQQDGREKAEDESRKPKKRRVEITHDILANATKAGLVYRPIVGSKWDSTDEYEYNKLQEEHHSNSVGDSQGDVRNSLDRLQRDYSLEPEIETEIFDENTRARASSPIMRRRFDSDPFRRDLSPRCYTPPPREFDRYQNRNFSPSHSRHSPPPRNFTHRDRSPVDRDSDPMNFGVGNYHATAAAQMFEQWSDSKYVLHLTQVVKKIIFSTERSLKPFINKVHACHKTIQRRLNTHGKVAEEASAKLKTAHNLKPEEEKTLRDQIAADADNKKKFDMFTVIFWFLKTKIDVENTLRRKATNEHGNRNVFLTSVSETLEDKLEQLRRCKLSLGDELKMGHSFNDIANIKEALEQSRGLIDDIRKEMKSIRKEVG